MEYLEHFGLSQEPFANDPNLDFYYPSPQHTDAERRVLRGVRQGKGLCVLLGEVGCGKTTLARHILEGLDEETFDASLIVMVHRAADAEWLLTRVARQVGVDDPAADRVALLGQVYERLVEIREAGRRTVLIVDEAQMLSSRGPVEELRGLLNLEHEEQRLLSLVLFGLPELEDVLALDSPLSQRIDIKVRLDRLDHESARAYLAHRIGLAGGKPDLLSADTVEALHHFGHGVPRLMNTLADNALFEAWLAGRERLGVEDVARAARDLAPARRAPAPEAAEAQAEDLAGPGRPETGTAEPEPAQLRAFAEGDTDPLLEAQAFPGDPREATRPSGAPPARREAELALDGPPKDEEVDDLFADLMEEP